MTKAPKNAPITLTGAVYDRYRDVSTDDPTSWIDLEPQDGLETENDLTQLVGEQLAIVRNKFERGDVALYQRSDTYGRDAIAGGHSNYGYAGYFKASVFDGKQWRAFKIWDFIPQSDRSYASQRELADVRERLTSLIQARAGLVAAWGNRTYELPTPAS